MNSQSNLAEYVVLLEKVIPLEVCEKSIKFANETDTWTVGEWYSYGSNERKKNTHSFTHALRNYKPFTTYIDSWFFDYKEYNGVEVTTSRRTRPTINRYQVGDYMDKHVDHIHSIFDGQYKGIPVMTTLGILNDDFEGGNFVLWDDYKIDLKVGDMLIFPSIFLYPHRVEKVTKGERYSWICWWF